MRFLPVRKMLFYSALSKDEIYIILSTKIAKVNPFKLFSLNSSEYFGRISHDSFKISRSSFDPRSTTIKGKLKRQDSGTHITIKVSNYFSFFFYLVILLILIPFSIVFTIQIFQTSDAGFFAIGAYVIILLVFIIPNRYFEYECAEIKRFLENTLEAEELTKV